MEMTRTSPKITKNGALKRNSAVKKSWKAFKDWLLPSTKKLIMVIWKSKILFLLLKRTFPPHFLIHLITTKIPTMNEKKSIKVSREVKNILKKLLQEQRVQATQILERMLPSSAKNAKVLYLKLR